MVQKLRTTLKLNSLESRLTPAMTLVYNGGNLMLTGVPNGDLNVTNIGGNKIKVTDGPTNFGTYNVTGNVNIMLRNRPGAINVDLGGAGAAGVPGNLFIDLGLGDVNIDPVTQKSDPVTVSNGRVGGNVFVRNGNGRETVQIGDPLTVTPVTVGSSVYFTGRTAAYPNIVGLGANIGDLLTISDNATIGSNVIAIQADAVAVLEDGDFSGLPARIGGNLIVNNSNAPTFVTANVNGLVAGDVVVIGSNFALPGFEGDVVSVALDGAIGGNLTATLFNGKNTLFVAADVVPGTVRLNGNLTYVGGDGVDNVNIDGTIAGSASVILGNGDNTFGLTGAINGNLSVLAGNGNDTLTPFAGFLGGNLDVNLGNGDNSLEIDSAFIGVAGYVRYQGGSGVDTLVIAGTHSFYLQAYLGAGADVLEYRDDGLGMFLGGATIDFGTDLDVDSYIDDQGFGGLVTVFWNTTLLNLP